MKRSYKTVLLGDASVGKSSFAVRLTKGEFSDNTNSTIGAAFFTYTVHNDGSDVQKRLNLNNDDKLVDGVSQSEVRSSSIASNYDENFTIKFDIWDTAGQERFKSIAPIYYRGAACAIVILDVSSPPTLQHAAFWVNQIRVANNNETIIVLVANKTDLLGTTPETLQTLANAKVYAKEQSISFVETSAKTGKNISYVFELLSQEISKDPFRWDKSTTNTSKSSSKPLKDDNKDKINKKSCCNLL
uniref:Small GTPase (Rab family member), putative n=1 Tax=Theileria annulata TaxID=5874 RepID=A0A3B0N0C0_THEAN